MRRGLVAVVGRPNTGKSSLFNYLAGRRISIVDDMPGVTRDRIYTEIEWLGQNFAMIDTGGIEPHSNDLILQAMREQAELAIATADVILLMVDIKSGLQASDEDIAQVLHKSGKPVIVAVNKVDRPGDLPSDFYDFYRLGFESVFPISAAHGIGMGDMLDAICKFLPFSDSQEEEELIKVAIVGRPNAGKSSLLNLLTGESRAIVSNIAGTTRDALETPFENQWGKFLLVDTAGMRRKSKIDDPLERYSILRATAAIERADICVHMIDATEGITEQDTKIAGLAHRSGKATIFVVNKWDLIERTEKAMDEYTEMLRSKLAYMPYAPVLYMSVKDNKRVYKLWPTIQKVYEAANRRIKTGLLNEIFSEAQQMFQAPQYKGRRLKIRYATQVAVAPPTFVLFVNSTDLLHFSYERYLENQLRKNVDFDGTPIRLKLRESEQKEK